MTSRSYLPIKLEKTFGKHELIYNLIEKDCFGAPTILHLGNSPVLMESFFASAHSLGRDMSKGMQATIREILGQDVGSAQIWMMYHWSKIMKPVLDLGSDLHRSFEETEVNVPTGELRLPFHCLYIAVPFNEESTLWSQDGDELHPIDGFMIYESDFREDDIEETDMKAETLPWDEQNYRVMHENLPKMFGGNLVPKSMLRSLTVLACARPLPGQGMADAAYVRFNIPLNFDGNFEYWIDEEEKHSRSHDLIGDHNMAQIRSWARVIVNTILYMGSEGADEQVCPLPDKMMKRAERMTKKQRAKYIDKHQKMNLIKLGHKLRLDDNMNHALADRKVGKRFIVRGHWRNQAHGPNRSLRKRKWIQPHWKGPPWAEVVHNRVYKAE